MFTPISILPNRNVKTEVEVETSSGIYVFRVKFAHYSEIGNKYAGSTNINFQYDDKEGFVKLLEQIEQAIHVARQENEI